MSKQADWKKVQEREKYYQGLADQALGKFQRACISPQGLAVPSAQIEDAAAEFLEKIDGLLKRAYDKGWEAGLLDAKKALEAQGIKSKYVKVAVPNPSDDFFNARQKLVERLEEVKPVLQQASGEDKDILPLKKTTAAVISVWANYSYSAAILNGVHQFENWVKSFPLREALHADI